MSSRFGWVDRHVGKACLAMNGVTPGNTTLVNLESNVMLMAQDRGEAWRCGMTRALVTNADCAKRAREARSTCDGSKCQHCTIPVVRRWV